MNLKLHQINLKIVRPISRVLNTCETPETCMTLCDSKVAFIKYIQQEGGRRFKNLGQTWFSYKLYSYLLIFESIFHLQNKYMIK